MLQEGLTYILGRRGKAQMEPDDVRESTKIANLRILVEQVKWRHKRFTILADEM